MSKLHFAAHLLAAACLSCAVAPLAAAPAKPRPKAVAAPAFSGYRINPEDVIEIRVRNHPDLNRAVTVRPDGRITFPRAGEVQAANRTPQELARSLQRLLERTLNNARVEVEVKEARARQVRLIGAVKTPGAYKMAPGWRVLDAIAAAGGPSAKPERIAGRVVRGPRDLPINVALALSNPASASNFALLPDDLLVLDESRVPNQVSVTGRVVRPGAYDLSEGLSLTGLLAQAGGVDPNASLRGAHVLRRGVPIALDLSGLDSPGGLSPAARAFRLQIGDVLVLPENTARVGVMGQVARPAYYAMSERVGEVSVLKVLAGAGGTSSDADGKAATITRTAGGTTETIPIDVEALQKGAAPDLMALRDGDVLFVPRRTAQVHALGPIGKPGPYPLRDNMSLLSLVAEAGVPSSGAGLRTAYVLRDGKPLNVDLYSVLVEGKTNDAISGFILRDRDVLVIPNVTPQVSVIGQVARPGAFVLDEKLSTASLLAQAGNASPSAALSQAYVLREGRQMPLDLQRFLVSGGGDAATASFKFLSGDVLVIPQNVSRLAIIGAVTRPGYYPFPELPGDATAVKALSLAGGPAGAGAEGGANLAQAGIIRTVNGQQTVIPVNLQEVLQKGNLAANIPLQPEDVLYIPTRKRGFKLTDALGILSPLAIFAR